MNGHQRQTDSGTALTIGAHSIRRDGDMWCMTDLWRAAGAPTKKRPGDWLATEVAREFCEYVTAANYAESSTAGPGGTRRKPGIPGKEPPTTWGHWQIALAYAKALSPEFHARVNEVYKAFTMGQLVPRDQSLTDEVTRLTLRIAAMNAADYESVWDLELKLELARLRKVKGWTPGPGNGPEPQALSFAYGRTWRIILGDKLYEELKRRNPRPKSGELHGQWIQDDRLKLIRREDMVVTLYIARRALKWTEFEKDMRTHFRRTPIQLRLVR